MKNDPADSWWAYLKRGLRRPMPQDRIMAQPGDQSLSDKLRNLLPFLARHWRKGILGAFLLLFGSLLAIPLPLLTRYLVDQVILLKRLDQLAWVVLVFAATKGLGMISGLLQQFYFTRFEQGVLLDIQSSLFERTLRFPKSFFDQKETGYLMSRLSSDVQGLRWFFSSVLVNIVSNLLRLLVGVALLFYLEWRLALVSLIVLPGIIIAVRYFASKLRILSRHSMEQQANISRQVQESLSSTTLIKAFSSERRTLEQIISAWQSAIQLNMEQVTVGSLANLALSILPDLANGVVLVVGAYWVILGQWTLGSLLAFRNYLGYVFGPALFLASANLQFQNALTALERVSALFSIVPEDNLGSGVRVERLSGQVEFRNVSFSYQPQEPVLDDISFQVKPGEHVAIVGPSGVGKTTLISLVLRFYKPTQGEIWFDGKPASEYEVGSLRQRIGYVSQNTMLLSGTIQDNLHYGNPEATQAEVIRAARAAGIHEFITSLPQGYDSPVGERGVNLSEGQKQRLSIARALIKDPDIIVLDEPTSAMDSILEKTIFDALPALVKGKTLFVVAHRLATVQHSDRILLLNEKRLVDMGTHNELFINNEYYRSLVENQQIILP